MVEYHPNFSDKRVKRRCERALGFVCGCLSESKPKASYSRSIDNFLGQSQDNLGKYLRACLLKCVDDYYNPETGVCKLYVRNPLGVKFIKQSIRGEIDIKWHDYAEYVKHEPQLLKEVEQDEFLFDQRMIANLIEAEYGNQLHTGEFDYNDKAHRLWHPIQQVRSAHKKLILSDWGYKHQYDIVACAPTIIEQLSRLYGNDLWMPYLSEYLEDNKKYRAQIASDLELDVKTTKIFINSLFCGARVGNNAQFATSELLDNDKTKIQLVKEHTQLIGLRDDIKTCWNYIIQSGEEISRRRDVETGRLKPVSSSEKWAVYFKYERQILNQAQRYLQDRNIKFLLEHDGWNCDNPIDVSELENQIRCSTGISLRLKYEKIE